MFAEQTFQDTEGVISRNAKRFISSVRMANAFHVATEEQHFMTALPSFPPYLCMEVGKRWAGYRKAYLLWRNAAEVGLVSEDQTSFMFPRGGCPLEMGVFEIRQ